MLALYPPYYTIKGVVVAPDTDDPYQFYYFPNRPHLAVDDGHPAVRLLVYKANLDDLTPDEEKAAGFFYFDTTLDWPEATLNKVAQKIQDDLSLDRLPRLAALPYKAGTVRLIFLGKQTPAPTPPGGAGAPPPAAPAPPDRWVVRAESSGVPSLYGDNRAIFSTVLTKEGTALVYGSFDGFMPAGVVYDLTYVGMRRAFNVKVDVDWDQVYHFMDDHTKVDLFFFQSDVENLVQQMYDKKVIKFVASLDGVGDEAMENEFNAVRKDVMEWVKDKFFQPAPFPDKQDVNPSVPDRAIDFLRQLRTLGMPSVGFTKRQVDINEDRTLSIDYTVNRAVERKIAPQAHISLFLSDFHLTLDQVRTVVNGADDFWKTVDFRASAVADFAPTGVAQVKVEVSTGADRQAGPSGEPRVTWAALLNKDVPEAKKSSWYDPAAGLDFSYQYETIFAPLAAPGEDQKLESGWHQGSGDKLVVIPGELYQSRTLDFSTVGFPFERFSQVLIEVRYTNPATGWQFHDSKVVSKDQPKATFAFRTRHGTPPAVEYRFTYAQSGAAGAPTAWQSTDSDLVLLLDPRPNRSTVQVIIAGDRTRIQELLLNFRYADPVDNHVDSAFIRLAKADLDKPQSWTFYPADVKRTRYTYSQVLVDVGGDVSQTGEVQADAAVPLTVGVVYMRLWEVVPELVGPPLADNDVARVKLSLHYEDAANGVVSDKQMIFAQPGRGEHWPLQLKDPSARSYTYTVSYVMKNGFERRAGPFSGTDTYPVISSVPPG